MVSPDASKSQAVASPQAIGGVTVIIRPTLQGLVSSLGYNRPTR